jgi:hypothetical protein
MIFLFACESPTRPDMEIIICKINQKVILCESQEEYYWFSYWGINNQRNILFAIGISDGIPNNTEINPGLKSFTISFRNNKYKYLITILNYNNDEMIIEKINLTYDLRR